MRFQRRKAQYYERTEMFDNESRWTYNKVLVLRFIQSRESEAKRTSWQTRRNARSVEWRLQVVA